MNTQFKPTEEMIDAAKTVFVAMAFRQTIEPVVKGYENEILTRHQFRIAREWTEKGVKDAVILNPKEAYLMEDSDFQVYLKECFEARDKAGLKVDNPEHCPLLVAETLQIDAENALLASLTPVTGLEAGSVYGDNRKKLIDLTLRLLAPFVK